MAGSNQGIANIPLNFDFLGGLMGIQGGGQSTAPLQTQFNPEQLLKQRLQLNQLQQLQLQNQIIQQQKSNTHFMGLPTPSNYTDSSQYRPDNHPHLPLPDMALAAQMSHNAHGVHSAPANLVFNTNPPVPLPSPGDMDFDLSPLTSPWLEAYKQGSLRINSNNKRTASPPEEGHDRLSRQRQSPAVNASQPRRQSRGSKSACSTPLIRSTRTDGRKNSMYPDIPEDTPSPVDLSMPPPAPPVPSNSSSLSTTNIEMSSSMSSTPTPNFTPVTPASIMNLGQLGTSSSLAPPQNSSMSKASGKAKAPSRRSREPSSSSQAIKKPSAGTPLVSPSLKPILPGNVVLHSLSLGAHLDLAAAGNVGFNVMPSPTVPVLRKTSHKAAEQKRRDSLKTTFDDLRTLLPPIPLPSEEGFPDEPILPGAMPPRGPPRGNVDGPNRSISKLQLLRCGNDYIRLLNGKIERRDVELASLRREVERLRGLVSEDVWKGPWKGSGSAYDGDEGDDD
ncbi:hypothetical protein HETIRDRAFT_157404 [Heterobasidion irregulare TC 32-1]|uniref:BHLH domain-containing protein n=1 Tax=Heterobasidion irregulare (strain TC 32-1) TaxID=747525 RepID=W4JYQ2_HETIT|nr:uncharacterized protein HETIRDRAFT_157404 [Heterobasidion irregulare TC 32-1]ETW77996.1 hypothetical protein HETIRDRAFT_157404 [Heterobasidion irregulare TC 32-1]